MFDLDIIDKIDKYEVNNLEECLALCAKLREKDNLPHRIFIKESSYLKSFEFPYSNFFIEGAIEISNSLYGNKLDDEGVIEKTSYVTIAGRTMGHFKDFIKSGKRSISNCSL